MLAVDSLKEILQYLENYGIYILSLCRALEGRYFELLNYGNNVGQRQDLSHSSAGETEPYFNVQRKPETLEVSCRLPLLPVMGLSGKVLVAGGAIGVASVRSCEKLPPCPIKPVPACSKTDPPLAKAKPVSNGGSVSVITYLRRGRKKLW